MESEPTSPKRHRPLSPVTVASPAVEITPPPELFDEENALPNIRLVHSKILRDSCKANFQLHTNLIKSKEERLIWANAAVIYKWKYRQVKGVALKSNCYDYVVYDANVIYEAAKNLPRDGNFERRLLWLMLSEKGVLYIGKGTGDRFTQQISHAIAAIKGTSAEPIDGDLPGGVVEVLRKLISRGCTIGFAKLIDNLSSAEAFAREANLISCIGRDILKN